MAAASEISMNAVGVTVLLEGCIFSRSNMRQAAKAFFRLGGEHVFVSPSENSFEVASRS